MLISSMDQLNYYAMPKDGYLEIDTSATGYSMGQASMLGSEEGSPTYLNEENSPKNGTKSSLYKTELCKRFSEFGSCRYGAKCQFAHGLNELRHVVRHPKYKTTKCKSYWGSGHCPYGSRCRFIHEETESMTTPPQYSPPSSMGGMFLHDKNPPHLTRLNSNSSDLGLNGGEGYLYGPGASNNAEHVLAGSYHGLSSPFDKESSGSTPWSRSQAKLNYASESYVKQQGGVSEAPNGANGGYPDLQDAIDALMKFSLSPGDNEPAPSNSNLGTISTTPHAATTGAPTVGATTGATPEPSTKADYSLDSDELWKDFPSLSHHSSVDHMDHFSDKEWPAGLSLSLEGTGLFNGLGESESPAGSPPSSGKKEGTSPRLSIFERFH